MILRGLGASIADILRGAAEEATKKVFGPNQGADLKEAAPATGSEEVVSLRWADAFQRSLVSACADTKTDQYYRGLLAREYWGLIGLIHIWRGAFPDDNSGRWFVAASDHTLFCFRIAGTPRRR